MDQPLFGEQKKQTQVTQWIVGLAVSLFTVFSIAVGVYFGIKITPRHFALVLSLLITFISTVILVRWYRDRDDMINPKFKYLLILLVICTVMMGISINVYVWVKPALPQPSCNGFYLTNKGKCLEYFDGAECPDCYDIDFVGYTILCVSCGGNSNNSSSSQTPNQMEYEYYTDIKN